MWAAEKPEIPRTSHRKLHVQRSTDITAERGGRRGGGFSTPSSIAYCVFLLNTNEWKRIWLCYLLAQFLSLAVALLVLSSPSTVNRIAPKKTTVKALHLTVATMSEEEGNNPRKRGHDTAFETPAPAPPPDDPPSDPAADELNEGQKAFAALYAGTPHGNSPPQPQDPEAPPPDLCAIHGLMREHGLDDLTDASQSDSVDHHLFVFLYVRGVPQSLNGQQRAEFLTEIRRNESDARNRLQAITKVLTTNSMAAVRRVRCPDDWKPKYPFPEDSQLNKWSLDKTRSSEIHEQFFLLFTESFVPHQEAQLSRNCYLPAAITAQTYAVRKGTLNDQSSPTSRTIRTDQYIRRAFGPDQLYRRIMHNKGGKASEVFENLSALPVKANAKISATDSNAAIILQHLQNYGAGLVTGFHVDAEFKEKERFSYSGRVAVDPNKKTGHAMVLVGFRKERATGEVWLLLQNWWKDKQFVEVTLEYFQSSKTIIYFPMQKHTKFKDCFRMSEDNFNETDFDDGGDDGEDEEEDGDHDEQFASGFSEPADVKGVHAPGSSRVVDNDAA